MGLVVLERRLQSGVLQRLPYHGDKMSPYALGHDGVVVTTTSGTISLYVMVVSSLGAAVSTWSSERILHFRECS